MKAARLKGPKDIAIEDIPVPAISDDEVLVEVKYCGICGTDVHGFLAPNYTPVGAYMGHEFSGVIAGVGSKVEAWKRGDRVVVQPTYWCGECYACRHGFLPSCDSQLKGLIGGSTEDNIPGGFADFARVAFPEKRLYLLPDEVSFEKGALVEPLACSLHAVRMSALKPGDSAMVLGAGPIGLGVIAFLKYGGADLIIATETNEKRAKIAKSFGADYVFNPQEVSDLPEEVLKLTKGVGADLVFECSGVPAVFQSATSFLRPRGQLMLVSLIQKEAHIIPFSFQAGELNLQASWCHADEFPMVINFLKKDTSPIKEIITSKIKLDDIVEKGFDRLLEPGHTELKILVSP